MRKIYLTSNKKQVPISLFNVLQDTTRIVALRSVDDSHNMAERWTASAGRQTIVKEPIIAQLLWGGKCVSSFATGIDLVRAQRGLAWMDTKFRYASNQTIILTNLCQASLRVSPR